MSSPQQKLRRRSGIETRLVPEGAILVDMNTGRCYRLNRVGAEIWSMLETPAGLPDHSAGVAARYSRAVEAIRDEVQALVEHLTKEQLLEPVA